MWNFALDPEGLAYKLPGAGSCGSGCRGVISVSGSTVTKNQECMYPSVPCYLLFVLLFSSRFFSSLSFLVPFKMEKDWNGYDLPSL